MAVKIIGGVLAAFGIFIIIENYGALVTNFINSKKHIKKFVSQTFLFGGLNLCIGLFMILPKYKLLALPALIIDPSIPMFIYYLICLFTGKIEK